MPKRKNKTQKKDKTLIGFDNIPKTDKTIWATDQFGKRKVLDIERYIIRSHIDNGGLATDYNKDRRELAIDEFKRRLLLQLKLSPSSRKIFQRKTKKKYNSKTQLDKSTLLFLDYGDKELFVVTESMYQNQIKLLNSMNLILVLKLL